MVLEGVKYKDIHTELDILPGTWDKWYYEDYKGFRKNVISWKRERLLKKSEKLSEEILDLPHFDDDGRTDTNILRVKQKESEFVRTTLGKDEGYSSRTEVTGRNGEPISTATEEISNLAKTLNELATGNNGTGFPGDGAAALPLDS